MVITATDSSDLSVNDTIQVTVNNVNDAPVVENPLEDVILDEYFEADTIDLTGVFSDQDPGDTLAWSAVSSDEGVVSVSVADTLLILAEAGLGVSTVVITATDSSGRLSVNDTIQVTVNNVNDPPVVDNPLPDRELDEYFEADTVDLRGVFSDEDPGDTLARSALSSDTTVVTVSVADTLLTITEVGLGISTVVVTATDSSGLSVNDAIEVTVNNVNDRPVVENPLPDVVLDEHFDTEIVELSAVFSDKDNDQLTFTAFNSNDDAVIVSVDGTTLTITEAGLGSSVVTVTASDESLSVDESFSVTVNNVNDPPEVVNPIDDQVLYEHFGNTVIGLEEVFSDPDDDLLLYTVESSDPTVVTVSVSGTNSLIITEQGLGTATIKVTADDTEFTESDDFEVVVNNVNDAPVVDSPISSISRNEGFGSEDIDLAPVFSDPDDDALTYSVVSSNINVVTVSITGTTLTISEVGDWFVNDYCNSQ